MLRGTPVRGLLRASACSCSLGLGRRGLAFPVPAHRVSQPFRIPVPGCSPPPSLAPVAPSTALLSAAASPCRFSRCAARPGRRSPLPCCSLPRSPAVLLAAARPRTARPGRPSTAARPHRLLAPVLLSSTPAAMSRFTRRLAGVPWREIAGEAASRVLLVAQAFCAVHVVNAHVFSLGFVEGPSMLPAMHLSGDLVVVDRVSPRFGRVSTGDVALLRSPENPRKVVAKRVLGMEGDAVTYLVDPGNSDASNTVVVPQGHVWVEGDNIYASRDSRHFGPIPYGLVTGKIFCRIWPLRSFGSIDPKE